MTAKISVIISESQFSALQSIATERQLSLSDVVREAIQQMLEGRCS
jgi:Arc/MetJ-type ribon-helix-helix transcriptional regulator